MEPPCISYYKLGFLQYFFLRTLAWISISLLWMTVLFLWILLTFLLLLIVLTWLIYSPFYTSALSSYMVFFWPKFLGSCFHWLVGHCMPPSSSWAPGLCSCYSGIFCPFQLFSEGTRYFVFVYPGGLSNLPYRSHLRTLYLATLLLGHSHLNIQGIFLFLLLLSFGSYSWVPIFSFMGLFSLKLGSFVFS